VAKLNPKKVKEDADKEERAGRYDKAIDLLKQLVAENPGDWNTINKIGDLHAKANNLKAANEHYARVANIQAKEGFYLKAIALWKKIQKNDPNDLAPYQNLADLYVKQGLLVDAKAQLQTVVEEYIKRGRVREAGDALKRMADIDPADLKVRSRLADLYIRDGNSAKAVEEHVAIAEELGKKGHLAEAVQVLEKGLKLDPRSGKMRAELARVHLLQKNYERAVSVLEEAIKQGTGDKDVYVRLGEAYLGAKRIPDAEGVLRNLLKQDPNDPDARTQMGRVFLIQGQYDQAFDQFLPIVERMMEKKDGERAAGVLQQIVQRSPGHIKSLAKLVEVYRHLRKDMLVNTTYSQMVEAYIQQGQMDQAAAILDILVGLEPMNEQHRGKLEFVRSKQKGGGARASVPASAPPAIGVEEDFELAGAEDVPLSLADEPPPPRAAAGRAPGRPTIELSGPLSGDDTEFISEHLAEGRVFRKYGLADKARDQFDAIVARFPDNQEARQELRDVYKEKGEKEQEAEQCLALAEICRLKGDSAGETRWQADAAALLPQAAPAPAPKPKPAPAAPAPAAAPIALSEPEPLNVPLEEVEEEAEEEIPLEVEEAGLEEPALEEPAEELQIDIGTEQAAESEEEISEQFVEEEEAPAFAEAPVADDPITRKLKAPVVPQKPPAPAAPPPKSPPAAAPPAPRAAATPAPKPSRIVPKPAAPPPPPPPRKAPLVAKPAAASGPAKAGVPPELQKILDEVESYVSLGFVDDAKEALGEIDPQFADHPALRQKLSELGLDAGTPAPKPVPAARPSPPRPAAPAAPARPAPPSRPPAAEKAAKPAAPPPPARPAPPPPPEPDFDMGSLVDEPPPVEESLDDASIEESSLEASEMDQGLDVEVAEPEGEEGPVVDDPFGELGLGEPPVSAVEEEPLSDGGGIDLGEELGDLFGAQAAVAEEPAPVDGTDLGDAGLADIFKEFKKGVDKQLGKEDYDTRYNLGIAYKEMGLIDEAIAEFQLAAKDENRMLECASMLGICFMEKGMPKLAVKWFEKGLASPGRGEEEYQGLRYDLATALEASGDTDRALGIFTELYGQDANFRDVAGKVRELRAALR
jgi:tetratricopeptide (TPR) repeat protein